MKYLEITIQNRKLYGLHVYGNKLRLFADNAETRHRTQTERVYEFRKNGKFEDLFFPLLSEAREFFQCSEIWAIPSSTASSVNRLQSQYGQQLRRVKDAETRKYNHAGVPDLSGVEISGSPDGKKILLIDDVVTSGGTMIAVAEMLEAKGAAVTCLCLGMNVKLFPEPPDAPILKRKLHEGSDVKVMEKKLKALFLRSSWRSGHSHISYSNRRKHNVRRKRTIRTAENTDSGSDPAR